MSIIAPYRTLFASIIDKFNANKGLSVVSLVGCATNIYICIYSDYLRIASLIFTDLSKIGNK